MAAASRHRGLADVLRARLNDVRPLRTGSRFTIFTAQLPCSDRRVVVKVPNAGSSPWLWDVLAHESRALTAIGPHPHIVALVQPLELGDGRIALVLERCAGSRPDRLHGGSTLAARGGVRRHQAGRRPGAGARRGLRPLRRAARQRAGEPRR